jgi:hypothetical protein
METMPRNRGYVQGLESVLAGHESGVYRLPGEVVTLLGAFDRLEAETNKVFEPSSTPADIGEAYATAAMTGQAFPPVDGIVQHQLEVKAHEELQSVLRDQTERMANRLRSAIHHQTDEIIVRVLRPVHAKAMATITSSIGTLKGELDPEMLMNAPAAQRKARTDLTEAVNLYGAIRAAYVQLVRFANGAAFKVDLSCEFENASAFRRHGQFLGAQEVAPDAPVERLAYYLAASLKPWLPTPGELAVRRDGDKAESQAANAAKRVRGGQPTPAQQRALIDGARGDQRVRGGRTLNV